MHKKVDVHEAAGMVLCHDVTQILPGKYKGPALKKGHIIREADIPLLLSMGKRHVYALGALDGFVHEDEAAERIAAAVKGANISNGCPSEGKINFTSLQQGLLKINTAVLTNINSTPDIMLATLHNNQVVAPDQIVAGTRVIPLLVAEEHLRQAEAVCSQEGPVLEIKPLRAARVGLITTGSEICRGLIEDAFSPVVRKKFAELGSFVFRQIMVSDELDRTVAAIQSLIRQGAEMVVLTGGMSVDPDDQTPASIRASGAQVVTYGAPVLPGAMFMLAWLGDVPIVGLPGCVMYHETSIFDLVIPRILAGDNVTRSDIIALGHGGLCLDCSICLYPKCAFGKGS